MYTYVYMNLYVSTYANESATTLRLLIPVLPHLANKVTFIGKKSLLARPIDEYKKLFGQDIDINNDRIIVNNKLHTNHCPQYKKEKNKKQAIWQKNIATALIFHILRSLY